MIDKDYLIEQLTDQNVLNIMFKLGSQPHGNIDKNEIWFSTICHGGNSHKLCYFKDSKSFHCYTNCGHMSIFTLIMNVEHCSFPTALYMVADELGISNRKGFNKASGISNTYGEINEIKNYLEIRRKKPTILQILPSIPNPNILNYFEDDVFYIGWEEEGISIPTMQYFGIRWYEIENHIIIPHQNINGEIVGIRRRSLQEKDKKNKYMPEILEGITYTHALNLNLYGLYQHKEAIKKFKKVVIAESEKSVMLAHEYYGDNAFVVATCGFNISNWHRDILLSLGVEEVILGFDKDFNVLDFEDVDENDAEYKQCQRYINRVYSLAHKFTSFCRTFVLWDTKNYLKLKDSPFDCGKEILEKLMKEKVEIITKGENE